MPAKYPAANDDHDDLFRSCEQPVDVGGETCRATPPPERRERPLDGQRRIRKADLSGIFPFGGVGVRPDGPEGPWALVERNVRRFARTPMHEAAHQKHERLP